MRQVRIGTPDDVDGMMKLALGATEENGMSNPDPRKLLGEIWSSLNLHHGIVGIIGHGPDLEAAILIRIEPMWYAYDDDLSVIERAIYVAPEYRVSRGERSQNVRGHLSLLVDFSLSVRAALNLPMFIGVLSSQRTEAKIRTYRKFLGEPSGAYWIVAGKTGAWKEQGAA